MTRKQSIALTALMAMSSSTFAVTDLETRAQAYASCLESHFATLKVSSSDKAATAKATFSSCDGQRSQLIAVLPSGANDPFLMKIDSVAQAAMTK